MIIEQQPKELLIYQLERALVHNENKSISPENAVHEMRRSFKRARSYLRLYKSLVSDNLFFSLDKKINQVAKSLTWFRESQVNFTSYNEYLEKLVKVVGGNAPYVIQNHLQQKKDKIYSAENLRGILVKSHSHIKDAISSINNQTMPDLTKDIIMQQVKKVFKETKEKYKEARSTFITEIVHDWRKYVKILLFETGFLYEINIHQNSEIIDILSEAGYLLGKDHDLAVMLEYLGTQNYYNQSEEKNEIKSFFDQKIIKKRKKAIELGESLFTLKSSRFIELVNNYQPLTDISQP